MRQRSPILSLLPRSAVEQNQEPQTSRPLETDTRLFARFMQGDDSAFMELFDRHTHRLYMYCLKFVGDRRQAEDLVQDLWERVIRFRSEEKGEIANPVGFMVRIARNLCLNHIRDRKGTASLDDVPEWQHPKAHVTELSHNEELVIAALPHLSTSYREVLILNAYSGYRFDEIAELLGEPVGAVRTRAWRARVQLGRIISALMEFDEKQDDNSTPDSTGKH